MVDLTIAFDQLKPREKVTPLALLSMLVAGYAICALVFLLLIGGNPMLLALRMIAAFALKIKDAGDLIPYWLLLAIGGVTVGVAPVRRRLWQRRRLVLLALIYSSVLVSIFSIVKNHMPLAQPFWADPYLVQIDEIVGFSRATGWLTQFSTHYLLLFYVNGWVMAATFLPVIILLVDDNELRQRRFILLWATCWIVLGNVMALMAMSVGPIFLDKLPQTQLADAYPEFQSLITGDDGVSLRWLKSFLWDAYSTQDYMIASGISAFPSVHVGMATVFALYIWSLMSDRRGGAIWQAVRWGLPALIVAAFLVLSVHLGWHYAVDGYVSILVIGGHYLWIGKRGT